jgi:hypothetical protein
MWRTHPGVTNLTDHVKLMSVGRYFGLGPATVTMVPQSPYRGFADAGAKLEHAACQCGLLFHSERSGYFGVAENYDEAGRTSSCISWRVLLEYVRSEKIRRLTKYYPSDG